MFSDTSLSTAVAWAEMKKKEESQMNGNATITPQGMSDA